MSITVIRHKVLKDNSIVQVITLMGVTGMAVYLQQYDLVGEGKTVFYSSVCYDSEHGAIERFNDYK